jgi:hypothetical protein
MNKEFSGKCVLYLNKSGQYEYATASGNQELAKISQELSAAGFSILGIRDIDVALALCQSDFQKQRYD